MKKDWKYIMYITIAAILLISIKLLSPKQYNWQVTYSHTDKNPYGAYALAELLPTLFPGHNVEHSYQTFYEIKDSLKRTGNVFSVSNSFHSEESDTKALLNHVAEGGTAFIAAQYYWGDFNDTLNFSTGDYLFQTGPLDKKDSISLQFVSPGFDSAHHYYYKTDNVHNYFSSFDTTRTTVIATNDIGKPVTIRIKWGKGNFILNCTPLAFTNIYLLANDNHSFLSNTLSYLPLEDLQWTEYYHVGRMEPTTELRFILQTEPLRWAYYLTIASILIFMLFEMKRKQRIIPVLQPLGNTTLEFVNTIGNLYYQNKEHKNIAEKKILFFMEQIRTRFYLSTTKIDSQFIEALRKKAGKDADDVRKLFHTIDLIRNSQSITAEQLIELNRQIEKFNS